MTFNGLLSEEEREIWDLFPPDEQEVMLYALDALVKLFPQYGNSVAWSSGKRFARSEHMMDAVTDYRVLRLASKEKLVDNIGETKREPSDSDLCHLDESSGLWRNVPLWAKTILRVLSASARDLHKRMSALEQIHKERLGA